MVGGVGEGLHNAPKLYGSSVRAREQPTDARSGVEAAGRVCLFLEHFESETDDSSLLQSVFHGYLVSLLV